MTYTILTAQNIVSLNRWENESTNTEQFNSILKRAAGLAQKNTIPSLH